MGVRTQKKTVSRDSARKGGRGSVGQEIFAQVEQLTANGAMKKLDAFKQVAQSSGRQLGTISANYYRVARKRGATLRPRRAAGARAGSSRAALAAVLTALQKLGASLDAQERELVSLRQDNRRFAELRRLLKS